MMTLAQLQKRLRNINQVALARLRLGDSVQILHERSILQQWVGGTVKLEEVTANTIEAALNAFHQTQLLKSARQIRLVCYGCTQTIGKDEFCLIENREHFEKLLKCLEGYAGRRRAFLKFYRGLLNSYFSYDPATPGASKTGRDNRELLRKFLARHLNSLARANVRPNWLVTLSQHTNLLSENPCKPYEIFIEQGDWSPFKDVCEDLEISADSWLVRQLVMASINYVAALEDALFKEHLDNIILLLSEYPLYASTGLRPMLDRYAECTETEVNTVLRDYAISLWGNPWLTENLQQWQCSDAARNMLSAWLKSHLLNGFFTLLCNDDKARARRFNFWNLYCQDITGMYFALGKDAFDFGNMPLNKFRHLAKGLIAKLSDGKADVHACILQFDTYHVVEFNRENTAAYFYDTRLGTPPFYLSKGWIEIGALNVAKITQTQGMDVAKLAKTVQHLDSDSMTWEENFAQLLGIKPGAA